MEVEGYKIRIYKSVAFNTPLNVIAKKEIKAIPFTTANKKEKILE
jgi:hypothetical protein